MQTDLLKYIKVCFKNVAKERKYNKKHNINIFIDVIVKKEGKCFDKNISPH